MVCFSIKQEQQSGLIFFSRMHFVRECVGLVNLVDSLIIFMVRCLSYLNSTSDIVYKECKILVHTMTFNIIVFNQQK